MTKKQKTLSRVVFGIYLVWLLWLILFKLTLPLPGRGLPLLRGRSVEWIPFAPRAIGPGQAAREMLDNLLVFVPFGAYLSALFPGWKPWKRIAAGFALSLCFEVLQFVFALGASDVTDVIMNTAGTLCGLFLWRVLQKLLREKALPVMNVCGLAGEALFFAMMALVVIYNYFL